MTDVRWQTKLTQNRVIRWNGLCSNLPNIAQLLTAGWHVDMLGTATCILAENVSVVEHWLKLKEHEAEENMSELATNGSLQTRQHTKSNQVRSDLRSFQLTVLVDRQTHTHTHRQTHRQAGKQTKQSTLMGHFRSVGILWKASVLVVHIKYCIKIQSVLSIFVKKNIKYKFYMTQESLIINEIRNGRYRVALRNTLQRLPVAKMLHKSPHSRRHKWLFSSVANILIKKL